MTAPHAIGFWGARTSSIDWCEANYEHSRYICEWFNTLSSLALVAAGIAGVLLHWRLLERRFSVAFLALAVVGLGSVAFHATLKFELQLLDELPMVYLALVMVYVLVQMRRPRPLGPWFQAVLVAYALALTVLVSCTRGTVEFWSFQISFGSLELYCLTQTWVLQRKSRAPIARKLFRVGMTSYVVAILAWFADTRFCSFLSVALPARGLVNPQLHAVWHVLVSLGFYSLLLLLGFERMAFLGQTPRLHWFGGWLACLGKASPATEESKSHKIPLPA